MTFHPIWDPGWLVGMVALTGLLALAVLIGTAGLVWEWRSRYSDGGGVATAIVCGIAAAILLIIFAFVSFPWKAQYHRFVPVTGTVTAPVTSRFLAGDNGGSNQKFLVTIGGRQYGCNDTRCAGLAKGDRVTLMCERAWQWAGTPGWDCNWGALRKSG